MRHASSRKQLEALDEQLGELVSTGALTPSGVKNVKIGALVAEFERDLDALFEQDKGLVNEVHDDLEVQSAPRDGDGRYGSLQRQLTRARGRVRELQGHGEKIEVGILKSSSLNDAAAQRKRLAEVEETLDVEVGAVRRLEQQLVEFCAELTRETYRSRKAAGPNTSSASHCLRYLDRDGSDVPAAARGRTRTGFTRTTIRSADLGVAAVRPS